jgi:hypothetical protein
MSKAAPFPALRTPNRILPRSESLTRVARALTASSSGFPGDFLDLSGRSFDYGSKNSPLSTAFDLLFRLVILITTSPETFHTRYSPLWKFTRPANHVRASHDKKNQKVAVVRGTNDRYTETWIGVCNLISQDLNSTFATTKGFVLGHVLAGDAREHSTTDPDEVRATCSLHERTNSTTVGSSRGPGDRVRGHQTGGCRHRNMH